MPGERRFPPEKIARLDSPERLQFQPAAPLVELVAAWAPGTVLDLGVGTGTYALPLCQRLPAARVIGLDVEPRMLEVFRERAEAAGCAGAVRFLEAAVERIPLPSATVDVALLVNLYHELDDRPGALVEIRRVLVPGGHLVICDWDPAAPGEHGPPLDHRIPRPTAEAELAAAGFVDVTAHALYPAVYTLSAGASRVT